MDFDMDLNIYMSGMFELCPATVHLLISVPCRHATGLHWLVCNAQARKPPTWCTTHAHPPLLATPPVRGRRRMWLPRDVSSERHDAAIVKHVVGKWVSECNGASEPRPRAAMSLKSELSAQEKGVPPLLQDLHHLRSNTTVITPTPDPALLLTTLNKPPLSRHVQAIDLDAVGGRVLPSPRAHALTSPRCTRTRLR
jgi:hypothetical protein